MSEVLRVKKWKGKDKISIQEGISCYTLIEHRKDKETGEIEEIQHKVHKLTVNNLMTILSETEHTDRYKYRDIVSQLIKHYKLDLDIDAFNGGRNRKNYFSLYYYPVKCLEAKGIIEYSGRGEIKLIYGGFL